MRLIFISRELGAMKPNYKILLIMWMLVFSQIVGGEVKYKIDDNFIYESLNKLFLFAEEVHELIVESNRNKILEKLTSKYFQDIKVHRSNMVHIASHFLKYKKSNNQNCDFFDLSVSLKSIETSMLKLKACVDYQCDEKKMSLEKTRSLLTYQLLEKGLIDCGK